MPPSPTAAKPKRPPFRLALRRFSRAVGDANHPSLLITRRLHPKQTRIAAILG